MKAKKVAAYGILVALAIALSYLENLIPWTVAAPGVKLGLANTVTIFALYRLSFRDACAISLLRVLLVGILFGNAFSLAFSAAGAIVSLAVMLPLSRAHPDNTILVCVAGGDLSRCGFDPRLADRLVLPPALPDRHPGWHWHRTALCLRPAADSAYRPVIAEVSPVCPGETLCLFSTNCQRTQWLLLAIPGEFS